MSTFLEEKKIEDASCIRRNTNKVFEAPFFIYNRALLLLTFKALLLFTSCVVEGRLSTNGGGSTLAHNIMWYRFLVLHYYYNSSSNKRGDQVVCVRSHAIIIFDWVFLMLMTLPARKLQLTSIASFLTRSSCLSWNQPFKNCIKERDFFML